MTCGKDKTIATLKSSMVVYSSEGGMYYWMIVKQGFFLEWWNYPVWYCNGECVIWWIYQNPWNFTTQMCLLIPRSLCTFIDTYVCDYNISYKTGLYQVLVIILLRYSDNKHWSL